MLLAFILYTEKGFNNSVILNYDSELNDLGYWYQQLIGESLGKKGKGITPIYHQRQRIIIVCFTTLFRWS